MQFQGSIWKSKFSHDISMYNTREAYVYMHENGNLYKKIVINYGLKRVRDREREK